MLSWLSIFVWIWIATCVLSLAQGVLLGLHTWEHRRFARRRIDDRRPVEHTRRVALLAPCKGLDLELESNLADLFHQDYPNYEIVFIVESADDPALAVIQGLMAREKAVAARVIIAGRATATGQKIHNLAAATADLGADVEIIAFVDSDVRPASGWLGRLVTRLARTEVGTVTGYRWFVPVRTTFSNCLLYSINASIAALLGAGGQHIVWGGSWAIRRSDFEDLKIRDEWHGTISDDLVATRSIQRAGLSIEFEPTCMTASPMDYSFVGLCSFLRRQHMIGRIYAPRFWLQTLGLMVSSSLALIGAAIWITVDIANGTWSPWPLAFVAGWYGLQVYRGWVRRGLAKIYVRDWTNPVAWAAWFDVWASPITLLYNTAVMCSACFGSSLVWRGITYRLDRRGRLKRMVQHGSGSSAVDQQAVIVSNEDQRKAA